MQMAKSLATVVKISVAHPLPLWPLTVIHQQRGTRQYTLNNEASMQEALDMP